MNELSGQLADLVPIYGLWVYAILFVLVLLETGTVVTFFIPGDAMLFVCGSFCATRVLDIEFFLPLSCVACIAGEFSNFYTGKYAGNIIIRYMPAFYNAKAITRAMDWVKRQNGWWVIAARIVPYLRSFSPFVAGFSQMKLLPFMRYNLIGAMLWLGLLVFGGYVLGQLPFVQKYSDWLFVFLLAAGLLPAIPWLWKKFVKKSN